MAKKTNHKSAGSEKGAVRGTGGGFDDNLGGPEPVKEPVYAKGQEREYLVTTPAEDLAKVRQISTRNERVCFGLLVAFAAVVRMQRLGTPDSVVFDEVHFGGHASKYINGTFFMDVHPPLAKLLFAAVGSIGGFKGNFTFEKIGLEYPADVPYVLMRAFPAFLGVLTVALLFLTLRASGVRPAVALAAGVLFAVENSYVTISRYILLDSPLIFFIAAAAYGYKRFENEVPFTFKWFRALVATGIALGLACSSKWVGLFTVIWVGLLNLWDLWFMIGDLSVSGAKIVKQTVTRALVLLGVPVVLYLSFFAVHLNYLPNEGDGSGFMSSAFRATLNGNNIPQNIVADVGVGSTVSIRHIDTQGGYLHSHNYMYETGSKQQQVTLYPHLDTNNHWLVELYNVSEAPTSFEQITDGTKIRLKHVLSQRRLHSHDEKAPVSDNDWQKEVSAYGYEGFGGDANDDFVVEIQKAYTKDEAAQQNLTALRSVFRLRHAMTGCYLFSHEVKLPKWGFEQQEVTCATQGVLKKSLWYVEYNTNPFLPEDTPRVDYEVPSFWDKVLEIHQRMWHINQNLNSPHAYDSSPDTWPFLSRGINYWGKPHLQVYLLGNAPVWWSVTALVAGFAVYVGIQILRWQRGAKIATNKYVYNFNVQAFKYILGYLVHFAPSFLMGRQLFLHHYLPAYYFGILALAHFLDLLVTVVLTHSKKRLGYAVVLSFVLLAVYFYYHYSAIIYGTPWTAEQCSNSKFLNWDYDCSKYFNTLKEFYADEAASVQSE